jgi:hypothetical protein
MDFTESLPVMTIPAPYGRWRARPSPRRQVARTFLESRQGRTFAEGVIEHMSKNALETVETAVDFAVTRWMHLPIRSEDESDYGIPAGLPYLKGFAWHCKLEADTGEDWPHYTNPFM